ncbi:MAG: valine--tRNA ligase [Candidatus Omnitrophota bacterium]|nr:MAG: valine--tRNA ligase [Candidatus Omnitrophota bacterium]
MEQLSKVYNPKEVEQKIYDYWEKNALFKTSITPDKKPYCIVIPPPNITGILHMGHALNNTIQDILIRFRRMQGYEALWMPGTDHAGIATQNVVERELAKKGLKRQDLGREKFLEEVWKWKKEYGSTIIKQLKKLGASCDWDRERFTMDEGLSNAVLEVFIRLYKKGLIHRGNYIINWCPRCQTALSDEEAPHRELDGYLYYIKYPFKSTNYELQTTNYITVATTRPETMLGDVAVAVNPKDKRFKELAGKTLILPLIEREIKIIEDEFVDPEFGTGAVKVTPAHDPNDFEMGKRHNLTPVNIMHPDGTLNNNAGDYEGMDRFEAREAILEDLKAKGLLQKVTPHRYAVGHCYRCHTIIEPYLSKQWFVKMKPLAKPAIEVVKKGKIKFFPKRWTKVYLEWMYNIKDWCISRQIWWGHRIPVFYCKDCQKKTGMRNEKLETSKEPAVIVSKTKPGKCPTCGGTNVVQDEDVLDTWFSSWLWPFSTFGWPFNQSSVQKQEFEYFYPTDCLATAQEIIFFWVARMIMAGMQFAGDIPFRDVYIHGTVRDKTGTKMSKSLGNIIDPLEIIDIYGADALRFSLISITAVGQDVFLSKEKFELGRNFANKIWNVSRFLLMNLKEKVEADLGSVHKQFKLTIADKWILSQLYRTLIAYTKALENYKFNEAANLLYEFVWHKYCDWYVEIAKLDINSQKTQIILYKVLEKSLRMLHPFMPFITEGIWSKLDEEKSIMISSIPHVQKQMINEESEKTMQSLIDIIVSIRNVRAEMNIPAKEKIDVIISAHSERLKDKLLDLESYIKTLAKVKNITAVVKAKRPKQAASCVLDKFDVFLPLKGIINIEAEKARLNKQLKIQESVIGALNAKLKNRDFLKKAPEAVVMGEKEKAQITKAKLEKLKESLKNLA